MLPAYTSCFPPIFEGMTRLPADTAAADRLPALVAELAGIDGKVKITHGGAFAATLVVPSQKWRSIVETLDILADPAAISDIQEADDEVAAGGGIDVEDLVQLSVEHPADGTTGGSTDPKPA